MDEAILQRVIKVFAEFKKMSPEDITPETTFEQLGLDSLDGLNLVFELEEEFNLMIPDDKVKEMKSVREVTEGIEYLLAHPDEQANAVKPPAA
jgi:acyl carrier protein